MDIFEFELRYLAYQGFENKFSLNLDQNTIINLVKRTDQGQLTKKLTETTPDELKGLTTDTFAEFKKQFILEHQDQKIKNITLNQYLERLEYEMKVIKEMQYNSYFLIVADYINRAKKNKIAVGPGRGSGAGSLLAYLIGITDIDPFDYDLLFERFLNPARISMPDIDTDFDDLAREKVVEYVKHKYGSDKVTLIGTYMSMAAKAAFKDTARVLGISFTNANKYSDLITEKTIGKSLEMNEEFKNLYQTDSTYKNIIDLALKLEGTVRQTGVHACGVIISPDKITSYSPIQYPPKAGSKGEKDESRKVTQYDGHYLEDIGLLKMDFLGLRNLSIITHTIKIIHAIYKKKCESIPTLFANYFDHMGFYPPLDDAFTYAKIFQKADTSGIFQFESDGMKKWLKELEPTSIDNIIAMVALYRPGPMEFIPSYIKRKIGEEKITYLPEDIYETLKQNYSVEIANQEQIKLTNDLEPFMNQTYGIPIYQEQLIRIVQAMAGFSLAEADLLRRGVGKKIREIIEKIKIDFVARAKVFKNYQTETALYVYEKMIEPAADYSFNKSHAACYAVIAYQTAYLKAHYPIEFHAALLRSLEDDIDKFAKFINELKIEGLQILPPNINSSYHHSAAIDNTIRIGFASIKGIGTEVADNLEIEREKNDKFTSLENFVQRCKYIINKKVIEALAKSGSLDELEDRKTILMNIEYILKYTKALLDQNKQIGLFDVGTFAVPLVLKEKHEIKLIEKLKMEYEIFKCFISAHPLDGLYGYLKKNYNFVSMMKNVEEFGDFKIFGFVREIRKIGIKGFIISLEDITGQITLFLKNILDLQLFDVLAVYGSKNKHTRVKQIIKYDLEKMIGHAKKNNYYQVRDTVIYVRTVRGKENEAKEIILPENIKIIQEIIFIIKNNSGKIKIKINQQIFQINEEGIKKINKVLKSEN